MRDTIDMARESKIYFTDRLVDVISMEDLKRFEALVRADEREKAKHNEEVLMNALWKACGDNGRVVRETIDSQGELK